MLCKLKPNFINSHTGKDYYDFEDNCKIIELTDDANYFFQPAGDYLITQKTKKIFSLFLFFYYFT